MLCPLCCAAAAKARARATATNKRTEKSMEDIKCVIYDLFYLDCRHQRLAHCITEMFVSRKAERHAICHITNATTYKNAYNRPKWTNLTIQFCFCFFFPPFLEIAASWEEWWTYDGISGEYRNIYWIVCAALGKMLPVTKTISSNYYYYWSMDDVIIFQLCFTCRMNGIFFSWLCLSHSAQLADAQRSILSHLICENIVIKWNMVYGGKKKARNAHSTALSF